MKRLLTMLVVFLAFGLIMFAGPRSAKANTWSVVSINQVGQEGSQPTIIATHFSKTPVFKNKLFRLNSENKNELLAVALSAVSMRKTVNIFINNDGITIDKIRILND